MSVSRCDEESARIEPNLPANACNRCCDAPLLFFTSLLFYICSAGPQLPHLHPCEGLCMPHT